MTDVVTAPRKQPTGTHCLRRYTLPYISPSKAENVRHTIIYRDNRSNQRLARFPERVIKGIAVHCSIHLINHFIQYLRSILITSDTKEATAYPDPPIVRYRTLSSGSPET